jgi:hypothetical protein
MPDHGRPEKQNPDGAGRCMPDRVIASTRKRKEPSGQAEAAERATRSVGSGTVRASSDMAGPGWATIRLAAQVGWRPSAVDRSALGRRMVDA